MGLIKIVKENEKSIKEYRNTLKILENKEKQEKRRQVEIRRQKEREQEETDRWMEKCRKKNKKEREEREEQKRVDEKWRKIESMKRREEKRAEREWRYQEIKERRREVNRQKVMKERKCFKYGEFGHMASHCRNVRAEEPTSVSPNRFEVLKVRVMQRGEGSSKEVAKDRREILREEKAKREVEKKKKKKKLLREVTVKIGLKQEEKEEGIIIEALLDSGATGLVISKEFVRRHKFKRTKLERPVYVRNVDGMFNYAGPIVDMVKVEIFLRDIRKGHR